MVSETKDPTKVAAGLIGARTRWGAPRLVRLDQLAPPVANAILALVRAASTKEAAGEAAPTAERGGHPHDPIAA